MDVAGGSLEVREVPAAGAAAPALVFLHEGLGCVSLWRDFPDRVAAATRRRAIVYSRRGYGASGSIALPRPVSFMHDEARGDLPALLDALNARDAILIGHSDGASIALLYASARPPGLRGVVALAPHVFVEDVTVASIAAAREAYLGGDLRERLARHHGDNVDAAFRGWNDVWLDPAFRAWNIARELAAIEVPILVIQGRQDEYGTLAQVDAIARGAPQVDAVVLDDCGHSPHRDQPEATLAAISRAVALWGGHR